MNTSTFATSPGDVTRLGTLVGVWAHPDDETYLSGGLLAIAAANGQRVVVVTATDGEAGFADPSRWPASRASLVRRAEGAAAMAALDVVDQRWLGYPDGECGLVDVDEAADRIAALLDEIRPDTVVTFGPDGLTGHADHRAVSAWVDEAVRRVASPPRVLHAVVEDGAHQRLAHLAERFDASVVPGLPLTVPREALAIHLQLDGSVLDRKLVALRAHATQTAPVIAALGERDYREWVAVESFMAAPTA